MITITIIINMIIRKKTIVIKKLQSSSLLQSQLWEEEERGRGTEGERALRRVGGPKFALFFTLPPQFSFFLPSWESSRGFWWCFQGQGPQMCRFGVLWLSCEAPAAQANFSQKVTIVIAITFIIIMTSNNNFLLQFPLCDNKKNLA